MVKKAESNGQKNLIPLTMRTKEAQREIRSKGAKASNKVQAEKRKLRELVEMFGAMKAPDKVKAVMQKMGVSDEQLTNNMAAVVGLFQKAIKGDVGAFNAIRDIVGEKPVEKQDINANVDNVINIGFVESEYTPKEDEADVDID